MVRGRKKDITVPLTRSVALQRDYRERKAKYVADLEEKCRLFQEQNQQLLKENTDLRFELEQKRLKENLEYVVSDEENKRAKALGDILSSLSSAVASIRVFQDLSKDIARNSTSSNLSFSSNGHAMQTLMSSITQTSVSPPLPTKPSCHVQLDNNLATTSALRVKIVNFPNPQPSATSLVSSAESTSGDHTICTSPSPAPPSASPPETRDHDYDSPEYWDTNSPSCCMGFFRCETVAMEEASDSGPAAKPRSIVNRHLQQEGSGPRVPVDNLASQSIDNSTRNIARGYGGIGGRRVASLCRDFDSCPEMLDESSSADMMEFRLGDRVEQSSLRSTARDG